MKLCINQTEIVPVKSSEYYSHFFLEVKQGEIYSFHTANWPLWVDLFIPCNAEGFNNPLLSQSKKRASHAKCFALCGAFDEKDDHLFIIGKQLNHYEAPQTGRMHFFANDHMDRKYYDNNFGYVKLHITRLV